MEPEVNSHMQTSSRLVGGSESSNSLPTVMADKIARTVRSIRELAVRKAPSVSESIDWARTLLALGAEDVDADIAAETLEVLLKYQTDIALARRELLES